MPIIQDRDVKYSYKRYRCYLQAVSAESNCVLVLHRCTTVGVFVWKTRRRRFESWYVFFFSFFFLSVYVWKCNAKGLFIFCI